MATVEEHIVEILAAAGIPAAGWVIRQGQLSETVDKCIVVTEFAGRDGERFHPLERPSVQVLVRGAPSDTSSTARRDMLATIAAVRAALHGVTALTVADGTHYSYIWASGGVAPLGYDSNRRPIATLTFVTAKEG